MSPAAEQRTSIESREPMVSFAVIRALIAVAAVLGMAIFGFPYGAWPAAMLAGAVLPWTLGVLAAARRSPRAVLSPIVVLGDMAVLGVLQAVEPELYVPVHFAALFLVAAHAHFQGEERSLPVGLAAPAVLIPISLATDVPVASGLLHIQEAVFATACLAAAIVVGALRSAESSGRLRARALSRHTIDTEARARRQLAQAIHDGPVQELTSVELMLASAEQALDKNETARGRSALSEARELVRSNVGFLRDEIVDLGPHAFEELSFDQAVSDCLTVWQRRYGFEIESDIHDGKLAPEVAGALFRITQEAVANAGRHSGASKVRVNLKRDGGRLTLEVTDDGRGFDEADPLGSAGAGHIGLASMRERAEMIGGELSLGSGDGGARVRVSVPV